MALPVDGKLNLKIRVQWKSVDKILEIPLDIMAGNVLRTGTTLDLGWLAGKVRVDVVEGTLEEPSAG